MVQSYLIAGLCLLAVLAGAERVRYDNYHVYKAVPKDASQVEFLSKLDGSSDSLIFLNDVVAPGSQIFIVVAPHKLADFLDILNQAGIYYEIVETNLQRKLDAEIEATPSYRSVRGYDWTQYHTLDETYQWLDDLAAKYPQVETVVAGKTYEGREIRGVKVSYGKGRKGIFVEGGIHAREWISPAVSTYILNQLLTSEDPTVRQIAEGYDWYFVVHTNPDGYVYTHNSDRLWRKTRSKNGFCYGTDPNRNWDFHWNEIGASNDPCSDSYAGKSAFSEIETKTLSEYIASLKGKVGAYISFHSFSQLILFPYGHTIEHAPNHNDLQQIGDVAAKALAQRYGTRFTVGNTYEAIYPAAGTSIDWVYGVLDIPLSYTFELRPASGGFDGFILPPEQIIPCAEETFDAVIAMIKESEDLGYLV